MRDVEARRAQGRAGGGGGTGTIVERDEAKGAGTLATLFGTLVRFVEEGLPGCGVMA